MNTAAPWQPWRSAREPHGRGTSKTPVDDERGEAGVLGKSVSVRPDASLVVGAPFCDAVSDLSQPLTRGPARWTLANHSACSACF